MPSHFKLRQLVLISLAVALTSAASATPPRADGTVVHTLIVTVGSIVLAFAVSVTIGVVFGLYPAMRAARLDPVLALHYE